MEEGSEKTDEDDGLVKLERRKEEVTAATSKGRPLGGGGPVEGGSPLGGPRVAFVVRKRLHQLSWPTGLP